VKRSLTLIAVAIMLLAPATAQAFDPATQAHAGACSETTVHVPRAVHDLRENGVLGTYVEVLGIDARGRSAVKVAEEELVVVKLRHGAVAANHGCEEGIVFPVGSRKLRAGEKVAIWVPRKLRGELCSGPGKDCVARRLTEKVVLPINCWNIDEGKFSVVVYVRRPPAPRPEPPAMAMPSAKAGLDCQAGAVVVELRNDPQASADASFLVDGKRHGPVAPGDAQKVKVPVAAGASVKVTVRSGGRTLLEHLYTSHCGTPATPSSKTPSAAKTPPSRALPAATATLTCIKEEFGLDEKGRIDVTLYNGAKATLPATFSVFVNGVTTSYGPLQPGQIRTIPALEFTVQEALEGLISEVEVRSGGMLLYSAVYENSCVEGG